MARSSRVTRTLPELLQALDQQEYLLRDSLHGLREDQAHLRPLATCLRTLICKSSGTEGFLWRLVNELRVCDELELACGASVNRDHQLSRGLALAKIPLWRAGYGPPGLPSESYSLREVIKNHEAIFVAGVQDVVYTHELLIGAIAEQMGAHEAEGLDNRLVRLNGFLLNQQPLYVSTLACDAELTLQICERVLDHAEQAAIYHRAQRAPDKGDVTLVARFALKGQLLGPAPVVTFRSLISEVEITVSAGLRSATFKLVKRGKQIAELAAPYPDGWGFNEDAVFALSYSSNHRQTRTIVNDRANGSPVACDLGWLDAREILQPDRHPATRDFVAVAFILSFCRMLRPSGCGDILGLSPDMREMMVTQPPDGPFPS